MSLGTSRVQSALLLTLLALSFSACASGIKPCSLAGDFSQVPVHPRGDMRCHQKLGKDGKSYVNHGEFFQYAPGTDIRILEGFFAEGKPSGVWRKFTAEGKNDGEISFEVPPRKESVSR